MNISLVEKQLLYQNKYVIEELGEFIKKYDNQSEKLFIVYLLLKAKKDFLFFCKLFYPFASGKETLDIHDGIRIECAVLQLHYERKINVPLVINTCPGHGKSTIIEILYSAFLIFNEPQQIIKSFTSSGKTLKENLPLFNEVVKSDLYKMGTNYKNTKTNSNGYYINNVLVKTMTTLGTSITGGNATQIIVDDANESDKIDGVIFENVNNKIHRSVLTRLRPKQDMRQPIFTQQRVCLNDNTNYLIETYKKANKPILHIVIKQFEPNDVVYKIPLANGEIFEITRKAGVLWDNKEILEIVELAKVNQFVYLTQYQQSPELAINIGLFKPHFFNSYKTLDEFELKDVFITTDVAYSSEGDYMCICAWCLAYTKNTHIKKLLLLECFYEKQENIIDRASCIKTYYDKYKNYYYNNNPIHFINLLIEHNGNNALISDLIRLEVSFFLLERSGSFNEFAGSKAIRASSAVSKLSYNYVLFSEDFIKTDIYEKIQRELNTNTIETIGKAGNTDDFCDVLSDAIILSSQINY